MFPVENLGILVMGGFLLNSLALFVKVIHHFVTSIFPQDCKKLIAGSDSWKFHCGSPEEMSAASEILRFYMPLTALAMFISSVMLGYGIKKESQLLVIPSFLTFFFVSCFTLTYLFPIYIIGAVICYYLLAKMDTRAYRGRYYWNKLFHENKELHQESMSFNKLSTAAKLHFDE